MGEVYLELRADAAFLFSFVERMARDAYRVNIEAYIIRKGREDTESFVTEIRFLFKDEDAPLVNGFIDTWAPAMAKAKVLQELTRYSNWIELEGE